MKRMKQILIFLLCCNVVVAQMPNKWVFDAPFQNNVYNFSGQNYTSILNSALNNVSFTNTGIADSAGHLVFYTNGISVWNGLHTKVPNSDTLAPSFQTKILFGTGNDQWSNAVFIPVPSDTNEYYLFYGGPDIYYQPPFITGGYVSSKFYYAKFNKTTNGAQGYTVSKNNVILNDTLGLAPCAIRHGNGRDWWIIVRHCWMGKFYRFLVDPTGVKGPWVQTIGPLNYAGYTNFKFAPGTNKIACSNAYHLPNQQYCDIYDFDRCTGLASNHVKLTFNDDNFNYFIFNGGCEFSPSGQYLYVSTPMILRQFDVTATNIAATGIVIDSAPGGWQYKGVHSRMQLGPDNKIYLDKRVNSSLWMSVIHFPDNAGLACGLTDSSITFASPIDGTMPHFPNYNVGAWAGSICDTLSAALPPAAQPPQVHTYHNALTQQLLVATTHMPGNSITVTIYATDGKLLHTGTHPIPATGIAQCYIPTHA